MINENKMEHNKINTKGSFQDFYYLSEEDFYPPSDNRTLKSYIYDVKYSPNFVEYAKFIYDLYEEEDYYEN